MKYFKTISLLILSVFTILNALGTAIREGGFVYEVEYKEGKYLNGELILIGLIEENGPNEEIVLPDSLFFFIENLAITEIAPNLFDGNPIVKSIIFPAHVTSISEGYFRNCESLEKIDCPGIENFGNSCFLGCRSLKTVNYGKQIKLKEPRAINFGDSCFMNCSSLQSINGEIQIIDNKTNLDMSFGNYCFANCPSLQSINGEMQIKSTNSNVTSKFGDYCLAKCTSLQNINGEEIIKGDTLFIPRTCINLGKNVFEGWDAEHLKIYAASTRPGQGFCRDLCLQSGSFGGLDNLKTAHFWRTCYTSDKCGIPFYGNNNLEEITFSSVFVNSNHWYEFNSKKGYPKEYEVSDFYSYLAQNNGTPALKKVIVNNDCIEPVALYYGDAELFIRSEKFLLADRIRETDSWTPNISFRDFADRWEHGALYSVRKLTLKASVKEICIDKFENLRELTVYSLMPPSYGKSSDGSCFSDKVYETAVLKVPAEALERYKQHSIWGRFKNIQAIGAADVDEIVTETDTAETEYFDLTGRKVSAPEKGIYIVKDSRGVRKVIF